MVQPDDRLQRLTDLVKRLRAPDGCPWDQEQEISDLRAYVIEEAHETADAITQGDWSALAGEIGDLLFQLVFVSQLADEQGEFDLSDVVDGIESKMIARHPHVFGDETYATAEEVHAAWERRKLDQEGASSVLSGVPRSLPALLAAYRMSQKAAGIGFDWADHFGVLDKVDEELDELKELIEVPADQIDRIRIEEELGDLFFALVNLARHFDIDPEAAGARANRKFRDRFERMEREIADSGAQLTQASSEELEQLWQRAKSGD